jgi:hypothetical protein
MTPTLHRNVVLDLLPLYVAGEASAETRALIEESLGVDPDLRRRAEEARAEFGIEPYQLATELQGDLQLRSLRRTRALLRWQRLAFGWAVAFTSLVVATAFSFDGRTVQGRMLLFQFPSIFWPCVGLAVSGWLHYFFFVRRRLRATRL